jgi:hypothetical protein
MVLLADKWVQQANARKYRLQISDQIGFETASPTLSVICKNWGIPRSGQKFMGREHSSEPLPRAIHVYGADAHQGGASRPAASARMLGGLDRCYGSGKLGLVKAASSIRPFSCPAFSIRRFLVWRAGKIGFDECWRHHPGRGKSKRIAGEQAGDTRYRVRERLRHAPPPLRTKKYPSPSCAILITPSREPDRLQRNWGEGVRRQAFFPVDQRQ